MAAQKAESQQFRMHISCNDKVADLFWRFIGVEQVVEILPLVIVLSNKA